MQAPEYQTLGFDTDDPTKLLSAAVATGHVRGLQKVPGFDLLAAFTDPSGARLSVVRRKGSEVTTMPALASAEHQRATVHRVGERLARVTLLPAEGESIELLMLVDDPTQYPERKPGDDGTVALIAQLFVGAICVRADVYADEDDFRARRPEEDAIWSSRTLASTSIVAEGILPPEQLSPRALVGMTVESAWRRTNELTGKPFWYGVGRSVVPLAFAMPAHFDLQPGNVVLGTFTLTASSGLWDRQ